MSILYDVANAVADKLRDTFPDTDVVVDCVPNFDPQEIESPKLVVVPWGIPEISRLDRASSKAEVEIMIGLLHYNSEIRNHAERDMQLLESAIRTLHTFEFETAESHITCMPEDIKWGDAYNAAELKDTCTFISYASAVWQCLFDQE